MPDSGGDPSDLGGYVIDRLAGRGGHAAVYLAHRPPASPPVALKVLDEHHRTPLELARLQREFDFARALNHPDIITMYEHG